MSNDAVVVEQFCHVIADVTLNKGPQTGYRLVFHSEM